MTYYILNPDGKPVPTQDTRLWAEWFEKSERHVAQEFIGESHVSTVFLGVDYSFNDSTPVLWETMVFGGSLSDETDRCTGNREQAEAMHQKMVERVRNNSPAGE